MVSIAAAMFKWKMYSWGLAWPRNSSDSGELGAAWLATMPPMCHSSVPLLISPTSTVALKFARRGSPIEGLCGGMRDCDEQQFKFKPSRSPFVPPARVPRVGLWKKRGLSVESHRGPVGWLLGFQAVEPFEPGRGSRCPSLLALYRLPVAALLAALLNVWRLTLSAALVWLLPSECYKTARCCQRLSGSLPNLPTAQFYTAPAFCKVFTTLSFFPPSSDLMRELRSQG